MTDFICTRLSREHSPNYTEGMQIIGTKIYHWSEIAGLTGTGFLNGTPYVATRLNGGMPCWMDRYFRGGGFIVHVSEDPWVVSCSQLRKWLIKRGVYSLIAIGGVR